jgi:hypothetical protein
MMPPPREGNARVPTCATTRTPQYGKASRCRPIYLKQPRFPIASTYLFQLLAARFQFVSRTWKNSPDQQREHAAQFVTHAALSLDDVSLVARNPRILFQSHPRNRKVFIAKAQEIKLC